MGWKRLGPVNVKERCDYYGWLDYIPLVCDTLYCSSRLLLITVRQVVKLLLLYERKVGR